MLDVWLYSHHNQLWCGVNGATFQVKSCGWDMFVVARKNAMICLAPHETRWIREFASLHPVYLAQSVRTLRLALLYK
jgi:hypothetical protein